MKKFFSVFLCAAMLISVFGFSGSAVDKAKTVTVSADNITHSVSDNMYGIFIEDISNAVEGGLNSNLVRNNSFEYKNDDLSRPGWKCSTELSFSSDVPMNENNTSYAVIKPEQGSALLKNFGFCEYYNNKSYKYNAKRASSGDMGIKQGERYDVSAYFLNTQSDVSVYFENNSGEPISDSGVMSVSKNENWTKYTVTLTADTTDDGILVFYFESDSEINIDFVVAEPQSSYGYGKDTWKYTTLRSDLYEAIKAMNPSFIRFPGGCVAEGDNLANNFDWKSTIGPLETRKQNYNLWRSDVVDYNNSYSVGYHEYFQLCEDVGAEPVPILNVGLTCQGRNKYDDWCKKYQNGEITEEEWNNYISSIALTPGTDEWNSYVQDILDLIEYANGDVSTVWGAKRAENGHPESFNLKYIGLGNENWGDVFFRNFDALKSAVNAAYPQIKVISSAGPAADGEQFDTSWNIISEKYNDTIVDEHYYRNDTWYIDNINRYDSYDRNGAKVFVGEYAASSKKVGTISTKSNLKAAVAEAAYMTGLEKNGDVVCMASYAPTFAKLNAQDWSINMIWFNSHSVVLTPSYYNQMLFMNNTGNEYISTSMPDDCDGLFQSATVDTDNNIIYVKLVNTSDKSIPFSYYFDGFESLNSASVITMTSRSKAAYNTVDTSYVAPIQTDAEITNNSVWLEAKPYSVNVIRLAYGSNNNPYSIWKAPLTEKQPVFYTDLEKALMIALPCAAVIIAAAAVIVVKTVKKKKRNKIK